MAAETWHDPSARNACRKLNLSLDTTSVNGPKWLEVLARIASKRVDTLLIQGLSWRRPANDSQLAALKF
jgi:hypothetical protein